MMSVHELAPLWLTAQLATVTTLILLVLGIPIAAWLAYSRSKFSVAAEALIAMPLVLPPSVLGFYLLLAFSPANLFGHWIVQLFGVPLVFSFTGLVVGSVIFNLPFMIQPITVALSELPPSLREASFTLGKSRLATFFRVELPCVFSAVGVGMVMSFAHTVGEFGVVLMLGGNIAGETRVASIAIYNYVESLNYDKAHALSLTLIAFAFITVITLQLLQKRRKKGM